MEHICEPQSILGKYFNWNKSRLTVFVNLLVGLFLVRTVNLSDLATVLYSEAKIAYIEGVSVPIAWISLRRTGNSKTDQRLSILETVINEIPIYLCPYSSFSF